MPIIRKIPNFRVITNKTPKKRTYPEANLVQAPLVKWCRLKGLPIFSVPNSGKRAIFNRERSLGLWAGVSDLFLMMPNNFYHGYFIELKAKGKFPTEKQWEFMEEASKRGYLAQWFDDWVKAKESIEKYLRDTYTSA
jgi:hypothetical protein